MYGRRKFLFWTWKGIIKVVFTFLNSQFCQNIIVFDEFTQKEIEILYDLKYSNYNSKNTNNIYYFIHNMKFLFEEKSKQEITEEELL